MWLEIELKLSNLLNHCINWGVLTQPSARHTGALPMDTVFSCFISAACGGEILLLQWDPIDLTPPDELHRLLLCDNPDKVHLKGFSCLGIRSEISPQGLHVIFTSSQPVPYNSGQLQKKCMITKQPLMLNQHLRRRQRQAVSLSSWAVVKQTVEEQVTVESG